jgi:hypothetical protein
MRKNVFSTKEMNGMNGVVNGVMVNGVNGVKVNGVKVNGVRLVLFVLFLALFQSVLLASGRMDVENGRKGVGKQVQGFVPQISNHSLLNRILQVYVREGRVNYKDLKANPGDLETYLDQVSKVKLKALSKREKLALFINAYNAYTLKLIIDHYPIKGWNPLFPGNSIRQISGAWDEWKIMVGGKRMTLNDLEHNYLRKLGDPRIHFAIVCAAKSCPPLASFAFDPDKVELQLDERVRHFMQLSDRFFFCADCRKIKLSKILEWFYGDFSKFAVEGTRSYKRYAGVMGFFLNYLDEDLRAKALNDKPSIDFLKYDWTLNE